VLARPELRLVPPAAALTARRSIRRGLLLGFGAGVFIASQELTYAKTYPTLAARERVAELFGNNAAFDAIAGTSRSLQTVAGFAAWKCLVVLVTVTAIASVLSATRLLRGEEEAGRSDLLAAGAVTRSSFAAQSVAGLATGLGAMFVASVAIAVSSGNRPSVRIPAGQSVYLCIVLLGEAACWMALGALSSQLATTRRQASGLAGSIVAVSFLLRMLADSHIGLSWLDWASPMGWAEECRPLTGARPVALLPLFGCAVAAAAVSIGLAARRDLGAGLLPVRDRPRRERSFVVTALRLSAVLTRSVVAAWITAIACFGLIVGLVARQGGIALAASASFERFLVRLGITGASSRAYLAFANLIMALVVALLVASLLSAMREEEESGRLETLLVTPISRLRWLAGRIVVATAASIAAGVVSGLSEWAGAAARHAGVPIAAALQGGLNILPQAWCLLGLGVLVFGLAPRLTSAAAYGIVTWSLVISLVGSGLQLSHFLLDTSLVHHMASVPLAGINWASAALLVAVGALGVVGGGLALSRRDLCGA
jgi:ABC-2 type transport system permease protein